MPPQPVIVHAADRDLESWDDPQRGVVPWRTQAS